MLVLGLTATGCACTSSRRAVSPPARSSSSAAPSVGVHRKVAEARHRRGPDRADARAPFPVGKRILTLVDTSRRVRLPDHRLTARTLVTIVRYPASGASSAVDRRDAPPDRAAGPFGLVVFGHGFAVTPRPYAPLLRAWTRAGFVVAAPVFPLTNANAPGGPHEADIVNQPRDLRFVISRILVLDRRRGSPLRGMIDPRRIAVSGHSDGGETALFAAYAPGYRDRRVDAAVILSGRCCRGPRRPHSGSQARPAARRVRPTRSDRPSFTYRAFGFVRAPRPKFLLRLIDAGHLRPHDPAAPAGRGRAGLRITLKRYL